MSCEDRQVRIHLRVPDGIYDKFKARKKLSWRYLTDYYSR